MGYWEISGGLIKRNRVQACTWCAKNKHIRDPSHRGGIGSPILLKSTQSKQS